MLSENRAERNQMEIICIDSFVPEDVQYDNRKIHLANSGIL